MKTGFSEIRLILFGPMTTEFKLLGHSLIRKALVAVAKGQDPDFVPREVIDLGLLVRTTGISWTPGRRFICLPRLHMSQTKAIREAGQKCAATVLAALPRLKKELSSVIKGESVSLWQQYAFLTVAALLLDLQIGEFLRQSGQVDKVDHGWRIWAVPYDPLVPAFGVRCVYDPKSGLGAGICWHEKLPPPPPLPEPRDLYALGLTLVSEGAPPEALMRLRFNGWLLGQRPAVPLFASEASSFWSTLEEVASEAIERAYKPVFDYVYPNRQSVISQEPLLLARMIMEQALEHLIAWTAVPAPKSSTACCWLWQGRSWCLVNETTGG